MLNRNRKGTHDDARAVSRIAATVLFVALATVSAAFAEGFQITPFVGYRFGGKIESTSFPIGTPIPIGSEIEVGDAAVYGVLFSYLLGPSLAIELHLDRQESELLLDRGAFGPEESLVDIDLEMAQIGMIYRWQAKQVQPFIGGAIGVTRLDPKAQGLSSETEFSLSFSGGVQVMFNDRVGLRLEGRLLSTFIDESDLEFCGDRFGCRGVSKDDYLEQGDVRAGLIFAF